MLNSEAYVRWHTQAVDAQDTPDRDGVEADLDEAVRVVTPPGSGIPPPVTP